MSSTEEEDSCLSRMNVSGRLANITTESPMSIDPQSFAEKCNISDLNVKNNINNSSANETSDVSTFVSNIELEPKKDRSQAKRSSIYDKFTYPCVPKFNCPEKIIFCIDMSADMEDLSFRKNDGSQHSPLSMVKRAIELFVHNKSYIDKKHEFSLMVLFESATWVREFTNDPVEIIDSLEDLTETQPCNSCDFASIVHLICEKFDLSVPIKLTPVLYNIRVILIYGRSDCMFHFSNDLLQDTLMKHPFLFLDIVYIHKPPSEENRCKEIYEALCDLDEQNKSYIFEVARNVTKLHNCVAKLLAHPLQRVAQKDSVYKFRDVLPRNV